MLEARPTQAIPPPAAASDPAAADSPDVRSLAFALAGTFVLRCASYGAGIIIPIYLGIQSRTHLDVTAGLASLVAVTFYTSELIGAPIFGGLSDRFGRKPFMVLGPLFGGVAIQLLGLTSIIPVLIVVRVLEGFSTASSAPSTLGFLSAQTAGSEQYRGRVMGFYEAATVVGLAAGAAMGGRLYERFGTVAFSLMALVYLGALALFAPVRDRGQRDPARTSHRGIFKRLLNRRIMRFAPAWVAANAVLGAWFSVGPFLASGAADRRQLLMGGFHPGAIGMAFLGFGVLFTLGAITWGFVMPSIGRQSTLLWGAGGLGFTSLALWLLNQVPEEGARHYTGFFVGLVAVGIFVESGFTPAALAYLAEIAEEQAQDRGSVMGVYSVLLSVGQLTGGALAAPFASRLGMNGLILLTGLLWVVATATVLLLGRSERRHAAGRTRATAAVA